MKQYMAWSSSACVTQPLCAALILASIDLAPTAGNEARKIRRELLHAGELASVINGHPRIVMSCS